MQDGEFNLIQQKNAMRNGVNLYLYVLMSDALGKASDKYKELKRHTMQIQNKVLLSVSGVFCVLLGIIYILSNSIFLQSFIDLEEIQTKKNINRISNSINTEIDDLNAFNADWAAWDDSYQFIIDGNDGYVAANIVDSTFINSRIDFIAYVNKSAKIIFGKKYDQINNKQVEISNDLKKLLNTESILLQPIKTSQAFGGIVELENSTYLISSSPIVDSNEEKESRGVLLMGRKVDEKLINRFTKTTQVASQLHHANEWADAKKAIVKEINGKDAPVIKFLNDKVIATYILLKDVFENPVVLIESKSNRAIYQQGVRASTYAMTVLIACAVIMAIILMFIIQRTVTSRIIRLERSINHIEKEGGTFDRIKNESTNDEIGSLVLQINSMLESIQISHHQLESSRADAERASLAKSNFLTSMSHELRTPLNAILGYSQLLNIRGTNLTESEAEWVSEIVVAGEYLLKLISELLELSSIESGDLKLDFEPVLISESFEKAINMVKPLATQKNVELSMETDALLGHQIHADKVRLQQILINLLTNAIKYNKQGGCVSLRAATIGRYCYIKIEDNGVGVSEEKIDEIFKPFNRGDVRNSTIDGVGIGLSITRRLIESMNGRVEVTSKLNVGSVFTLVLPLR